MLPVYKLMNNWGSNKKYAEPIIVLDFEATCWETPAAQGNKSQGIIEFPSVLIRDNKVVSEIQNYVKPKEKVSKFCTELTGITQATVDNGVTLSKAVQEHDKWVRENDAYDAYVVTCGNWDLGTMLPKQCSMNDTPEYLRQWINIKDEFQYFYNTSKPMGMAGMLKYLKIPLVGKHHSGIDDCRNLSKIWIRMVNDGYDPNNALVKYRRN